MTEMDPTGATMMLVDRLSMALALLETVVEEGLTADHEATVRLFLADTMHELCSFREPS